MPFQAVPNVLKTDIVMEYGAQTCINTFYTFNAGGWESLVDVQAVTDVFAAWIDTHWKANFVTVLNFLRVESRDISQAEGLYWSVVLSSVNGTNGNPGSPSNVSLAIQRVSSLTGRRNRGRIYVVGIPETETTQTQVNEAYGDNIVDDLNTLNDLIGVAGYIPVIVSRVGTGGLNNPGTSIAIDHWQYANINIDSQRRRLRR